MLFGLFRKQKTIDGEPSRPAGKLVRFILRVQERWALYMSRQSEKVSVGTRKKILVVFLLLSGGSSVFIAANHLLHRPAKLFSVTAIRKPSYVTETGEAKLSVPAVIITEKEYLRILRFHAYMDSLPMTKRGRLRYDSIVAARPKLMDSVQQLEFIYKNQKYEK